MGNKPDVVMMDIHMTRLDGFEATRRIMETQPVPIVICSATARALDIVTTFRAMEAGAIACIEKPVGGEHDDFEAKAAQLLETVKLMSEVKVVRRTARSRRAPFPRGPPPPLPIRIRPVKPCWQCAPTRPPPLSQNTITGLPNASPPSRFARPPLARAFF